jgi:hypothetical protein
MFRIFSASNCPRPVVFPGFDGTFKVIQTQDDGFSFRCTLASKLHQIGFALIADRLLPRYKGTLSTDIFALNQ